MNVYLNKNLKANQIFYYFEWNFYLFESSVVLKDILNFDKLPKSRYDSHYWYWDNLSNLLDCNRKNHETVQKFQVFFLQTNLLFVTNKQRLSHPKKCKLGFNGNLNLIYKLAVLPPYDFWSCAENKKGWKRFDLKLFINNLCIIFKKVGLAKTFKFFLVSLTNEGRSHESQKDWCLNMRYDTNHMLIPI